MVTKKKKGSSVTTEKEKKKTKQIIHSQQSFVKMQDDRTHENLGLLVMSPFCP